MDSITLPGYHLTIKNPDGVEVIYQALTLHVPVRIKRTKHGARVKIAKHGIERATAAALRELADELDQ